MKDPHTDDLYWDSLSWQDIQAIGMVLAERHPDENILILPPERLAELVEEIPQFQTGNRPPDEFILSAIITAWIAAQMDDDDSSPFEYLA